MNKKVLGTFTLAMITMAAIISLRNLSLTAELGISAVFFLCIAAIIFFIPCALIIAELAAAWPKPGACYVWVGEAFGKPIAFFTLWLSWMASVAWFPAILAFIAAMMAHIWSPIYPNLEYNTTFVLLTMLCVFWTITIGNFFGIELSGIFSSIGVITGTLIPGALIIVLGFYWFLAGHQAHIELTWSNLTPNLDIDNLSLFAGVLLSLAGVELAAYHVREAKDPQHSYPRAILLASILILTVYILGTLSISLVVPQHELSLASGLIQAFSVFFHQVGITWFVPLMAAFLLIGALAGLNAWVVGPAKGMLIVAQDGFLPAWLKQVNKRGVPVALLLMQAIFSSALALLFIYIRNDNTSIWLLTSLSAQFTCVVYVLIFAAAIKLRYSQAKTERPFKVKLITPLGLSGIISCAFAFFIVYVPHTKLVTLNTTVYNLLLIINFAILALPPTLLVLHRRRSHNRSK
jgi:amino acid transporter